MGRMKESIITMGMMIMVATMIAGSLHVSRLMMGEAHEPLEVVYLDFVTCCVGVIFDIMIMGVVNKRVRAGSVKWWGPGPRARHGLMAWVVVAPVRASIHVLVGVIVLLPEPNYPSGVLAVYLFLLAGSLTVCAWRTLLYSRFVRKGLPEVDDNPPRPHVPRRTNFLPSIRESFNASTTTNAASTTRGPREYAGS